MLCVDCLIENQEEMEAIVVTNGFSVCIEHLNKLIQRTQRAYHSDIDEYDKRLAIMDNYLENT